MQRIVFPFSTRDPFIYQAVPMVLTQEGDATNCVGVSLGLRVSPTERAIQLSSAGTTTSSKIPIASLIKLS